jgi:hypothetical protein
MAFATSNVVRRNRGDVSVMAGNWTAAAGDAAGTISLGSAAFGARFYPNLSSGSSQQNVRVSGLGTTTLTVHHLETVTNGYFEVEFKG